MIKKRFSKIFKISKKDLIIIMAISALFCIPIITNLGEGDDLYYHLNRIEGIAQGLRARTFPVYIYPYHNFGFGYAAPMFYSDIFLYIPSILYLLGCPIMIVYKFTLCFFVLLGNYVVLKILRTLYNEDAIVYIGLLVYCFGGSRIYDIFERGSLGSIIAYSILPIVFINIYRLIKENKNCWFGLGLSFLLLLLSHTLSFAIVCFIFLVIIIINIKKVVSNKTYLTIIKGIIFAVLLGAFFIFPFIEQKVSQKFWMDFIVPSNGPAYLKSSQLSFNELFQKSQTFSAHTFGIVNIFITVVLYIFYKIKNLKFSYIDIIFIGILFSQCLTSKIFDLSSLSILYIFQFSWRIIIVTFILVIFLICELLSRNNNNVINYSVLFLLLIYNLFTYYKYAKNFSALPTNFDINTARMSENSTSSSFKDSIQLSKGEYLPYTNSYDYCHSPKCIVFPNEDGYIFEYDRVGTTITFTSDINYDEKVYMPLSWYKGYYYQELDQNNNLIFEKECFYNEYSKRVGMDVEKGYHVYKVFYKGTFIQKLSLIISILTIIGTYMLFRKNKNTLKKQKNTFDKILIESNGG